MSIQVEITPAERYRVKREMTGEKQINVWVEGSLTERLDSLIKTGKFRNRSEAVTAALSKLIEERK